MAELATMGPLLNEVLIEYHNATVSRRLALLRVEFQDIRDASVNVGRMREFYRRLRILFEVENAGDLEDQLGGEDDRCDMDTEGENPSSNVQLTGRLSRVSRGAWNKAKALNECYK